MYCAQWLIPVLLIPKHWLHPLFLVEQALFMWFYIIAFFLERRPCHICSAIFFIALGLLCWTDPDTCIFWPTCDRKLNGEVSFLFISCVGIVRISEPPLVTQRWKREDQYFSEVNGVQF
ncbi:hypothetical protein ANCCAN_03141 [Ancylostoma caninum]|uniref:Bladder cancer-associated protein n=1 Tax=Ancylostoma caninum TaxID=29170 RepID=A0A368H662_ANCCA|nr:hypothetical protein ANCCAN_03141 [Ancylostoma caninum]